MLTLAVNVVVMTVALYAVLWPTCVDDAPAIQTAWDAPGDRSGACSRRSLLIFVELMLVTAVALFFSTFSTPMLSAVLTFGVYIVGQFNADLKNFDQSSTRRRRSGSRAASTTCCPICPRST